MEPKWGKVSKCNVFWANDAQQVGAINQAVKALNDDEPMQAVNTLIGAFDDILTDIIPNEQALELIKSYDNIMQIKLMTQDLSNPDAEYVYLDGNGWLADLDTATIEMLIDDLINNLE